MQRFKYAGNGRSAQEADKAARGGQSRLWSEAKDLPKTVNEFCRDCGGLGRT